MAERTGASPIVIAGGGMAGGNAPVTLRPEGFRGRVALIGREPGIPLAWHAVVVGMGFIGCEVTASLTQLGVHVTAVFPGKVPLGRVLGEEVGAVIGAIHRGNGVELLAGEQIAAFEGTGRLDTGVTASGVRVACDFAVAGLGIDPDVPAMAGPQAARGGGGWGRWPSRGRTVPDYRA